MGQNNKFPPFWSHINCTTIFMTRIQEQISRYMVPRMRESQVSLPGNFINYHTNITTHSLTRHLHQYINNIEIKKCGNPQSMENISITPTHIQNILIAYDTYVTNKNVKNIVTGSTFQDPSLERRAHMEIKTSMVDEVTTYLCS